MKSENRLVVLFFSAVLLFGCDESFYLTAFLDGIPNALAVSPQNAVVTTLATTVFEASGGKEPYFYHVSAGPGSIDVDTGEFTSLTGGRTTIRAVDVLGKWGETEIDVMATSATGIWISPTSVVVDEGDVVEFSCGGGDGSYTYSLFAGEGRLDAVRGLFTPGAKPWPVGFGVVEVTDGSANSALAIVVYIDPNRTFVVSPAAAVMYLDDSLAFTAVGGVPQITWDVGSVSSIPAMSPGASSTYSPWTTGLGIVRATDDTSSDAFSPVIIIEK